MNIALACICGALLIVPAFADPAVDALFDRSRLHEVQISMADSDWAALRANYLENTNYDATFAFDGETIANCTIRSRGSGTRNGVKPGLRVDFGRKVKGQTFHGFKNPRRQHVQRFDRAVAAVQSVIATRGASVEAQLNATRRRSVRH